MITGSSRTVAGAALLVGVGFLGSRLLGALRAVAIANEYGTGPELDAFWVAVRLPDLVFQVLAGATLASAFIPVYARYMARHGDEAAWRLASIVLNWVLVGTIVLALVVMALAPWIVPAMAPGLGEDSGIQDELRDRAIFLTRVMLFAPVLFAVSGMITGMLNARRHFLLPALAPMLYNLAIIGAAVLLSGRYGVDALAIGVIVGSGLHLVVQLPALVAAGARLAPALDLREPGAREVLRLMAPRMIGLAAVQLNLVVLMFFASFEGPSAISALNFAWLILLFPVGLFGMSLAMAIFPALAEQAARCAREEVTAMVSRALRFVLFLTIPTSIGLILLREPLVRTLLEHGAFSAASTDLVAAALLYYAIGLFAHGAIEILSRGFYALGDTRTPVTFAVAAIAVNIVLAAVLVGPLDIRGLALALSLATIAEALALFVALHRRLNFGLWTRPFASSLARTAIGSALMAEALVLLLSVLDEGGDFGPRSFFALVVGGAMGVVVYGTIALVLRAEEAEAIAARVQALLRRRQASSTIRPRS